MRFKPQLFLRAPGEAPDWRSRAETMALSTSLCVSASATSRPPTTRDWAASLDDADQRSRENPLVIRPKKSFGHVQRSLGIVNLTRELASTRQSCRSKLSRSCCHCQPSYHCAWPKGIPQHIHLTARVTADVPQFILERWRILNPTFKVTVHDDGDSEAFVAREWQNHARGEGTAWLEIWRRAKDQTKSDLFRVLYLYVFGGVYADWDIEPIASLQSWVRPTDAFVTSGSRVGGTVNGHFLISRPADPVLKRAMDHLLARVERHPFGNESAPSRMHPNSPRCQSGWLVDA